jgi:acyl-CoA synthetase (NDP forming)
MAWDPEFEVAFNPKTVAIVGASRDPMSWGDFVGNLQHAGYPGRIYPVNPKAAGEEIHGCKFYPNLTSVPEPIDLVIISVPRTAVPSVLEDCIAADAKNIHIFTAGFKETGEEKGIELEKRVQEIAKRGGLRIVGPNCMGLHVPASRITTWDQFSPETGPVAFLSQSGGHAGEFVNGGTRSGIRFSKVVSYGNASVLDSTDFLEYLATDPETRIICMYLEGVRDGNRLTELVREINRTKPVIVWKGGLTEWGAKAVASHTGALGGEKEVWDAFYRQTGAARVDSLEELIDVTMTFCYLDPLPSARVALIGAGGGNSVAGADICGRHGLELPTLTEKTLGELSSFIPPEGTIIRNPLDIGIVLRDINLLLRSLEPVAADPLIDAVIFALPLGWAFVGAAAASLAAQGRQISADALRQESEKQAQVVMDSLIKFDHENVYGKPLIIVLQAGMGPVLPGLRTQIQQQLLNGGITVYFSLERASRAVGKFIEYHRFLREAQGE